MVPDDAAAARLVAEVRLADRTRRPSGGIPASAYYDSAPPGPAQVRAPAPDATFSEHGSDVSFDYEAGSGRLAAHLDGQEAYGERIERADGRRTVYVRDRLSGRGGISIGGRSLSGAAAGEERYGITYDRAGHALDFEVLAAVDVAGTAGLSPSLGAAAGLLQVGLHGERHVETEQHLDLTDPVNRDAVGRYLAALGDDGPAGLRLAAVGLRGRLARSGTISARTYAQRFSAHEAGGQARLGGIGVGGEAGTEDTGRRLLAAAVRGPGGVWRTDAGCVAA